MRWIARLVTLGLLGSTLACAPATPVADPKVVDTEIRAMVTNWNGYLSGQNDSAIAALYADDAVLMPPAMPRLSGRENIRQFWAQIWPLKARLSLTPLSVKVAKSGDFAVEEGNWSWSAPTPAGDQNDHGKYLVTWVKSDKGWQVVQDVWNSDQAPPAPAGAPAKGS